ncbi:MAG: allophanate hydrolase subunit 1 [Mycobacteriales bacterium]
MRFLPVGRRALLVEVDDLDTVIGLAAALRRDPPPGVIDMVPAARTLLITYDGTTSASGLVDIVRDQPLDAAPKRGGEPVQIEVTYDGPDLAAVAEQTGLSEDDIVERHIAADYLVAFVGFAPGFAYLVGGDPALQVARRDTPRTKVPAGSVALAGEFTGVYPREAPGGWQLIGRTDATLWDLGRDPPALLPPGTPVRFVGARP